MSRYGLSLDFIRSIKLPKVHSGPTREIYSLEEVNIINVWDKCKCVNLDWYWEI